MFDIKPKETKRSVSEIQDCENKLHIIALNIAEVEGSHAILTSSYEQVKDSLDIILQNINGIAKDAGDVKASLQRIIEEYCDAESNAYGRGGWKVEKKLKAGVLEGKFFDDDDDDDEGKGSKNHGFKKSKDFVEKTLDKKNGLKDVNPNDEKAVKENKENAEFDPDVNVKYADYSVGAEHSAWESLIGSEEGSHVHSEFGKGEVDFDAYAGMYGLGAEVGASYSAFTSEQVAKFGDDNFGIDLELTETVGRAGVEGEVEGNIFDEDGKFNPSLYGGVDAEVVLGEVTGSVGGSIAGVDLKAQGSVNFGLGAHAHVGFKDGVASFDVGASLGVGFSASFEVDVGGAIEAITDFAKSMFDFYV